MGQAFDDGAGAGGDDKNELKEHESLIWVSFRICLLFAEMT